MQLEYGTPDEWMQYARGDLAIARLPLPEGAVYEQLCFHAQQAAEKAIKAVLIHRETPFPKSHSIELLLGLLPRDLPPPGAPVALAGLTPYAAFMRYPTTGEPVESDEYAEAVRLAAEVVEWAAGIIEGAESEDQPTGDE